MLSQVGYLEDTTSTRYHQTRHFSIKQQLVAPQEDGADSKLAQRKRNIITVFNTYSKENNIDTVGVFHSAQQNTLRPLQYEVIPDSNTAAVVVDGSSSICTTYTTLKIGFQ